MNEKWKPIIGYENYYEISNIGNCKSKKRIVNRNRNKIRYKLIIKEKLLKLIKSNVNGNIIYLMVRLTKNKKQKQFYIHRLVAKAFIPNPKNLPCVNHKDFNTLNNNIDNLEWCSYKYNTNYSRKNGRYPKLYKHSQSFKYKPKKKKIKYIYQYDLNMNLIKIYSSINEAARNLKVSKQLIHASIKYKTCKALGFIWEREIKEIIENIS